MRQMLVAMFLMSAAIADAAVSDFTRMVVSTKLNGWDGVQFIKWTKTKSSSNCGRGWAVKFDLSKGYRLRTQFGDAKRNRATVGTMAECVADAEGVAPIMGVNADYFDMNVSYARCTGLVITDDELVTRGTTNGSAAAMCYIMQMADGNLVHSAMTRHASAPSGCPSASWQVSANGRKIRQAIRTNYCNYPVKAGKMNPVANPVSTGGATFPTTIGNMQSRTQYPRPLIGIGTNAVGVATNLVLFVNDGRQTDWSNNFPDVDAYQIMIDEGCSEVGEFDGGGSAAMWMAFGDESEYNFGTTHQTAHGNYVNKPSDGSPRKDVCGIFVLPPKKVDYTVEVNDGNLYADLDGAFKAVAPGDTVKVTATTDFAAGEVPMNCTLTAAGSAKVNSLKDPVVSKGARVIIRDVTFEKAGAAAVLSVAAGGTASVSGRVGVAKIATADAAGFEVAGELTADVVVECAAGGSVGQTFGRSSLSPEAVAGSLRHLRHPSDRTLAARAVAGAGGTELVWKVGVTFGGSSDAEGFNYTNRAVSVAVDAVDGDFGDGAKLRLTVRDAAGSAVATLDRELRGTGVYAFDTAEAAQSSIGPGKNYSYEVTVVDANGQAFAGADSATGSFLTATDANWFSAFASNDSTSGGRWTVKPEIKDGAYSIMGGTTYAFEPMEARGGIVRVTSKVHFGGGYVEETLNRLCQEYETELPQSVLSMKELSDESLVWVGLVRENGQLKMKELRGLAAQEEHTYRCRQEIDYTSGAPRVSYLVAEGSGDFARLSDASGNVWFDGPNANATEVSRMEMKGATKVFGVVGSYADRSLLRVAGGQIVLLTNVILDPMTLEAGVYALDCGGKAFRWTDGGRGVVYDRQTGMVRILADAPKNGYSSYTSYLLNLDAEDADSKPIATFARDETSGKTKIKLMLANGKEFKPRGSTETGIEVKVALESADNLNFDNSELGTKKAPGEFAPEVDSSDQPCRFYKCHIYLER